MNGNEQDGGLAMQQRMAFLRILGKEADGGLLWLPQADGEKPPCLYVRAVLVRPLIALNDVMQADAHLPRRARGWRRPEKLATASANDDSPVGAETVRKYLYALQRAVTHVFEQQGNR